MESTQDVELVSLDEAARRLGVKRRFVDVLVAQGRLEKVVLSRKTHRITTTSLREFVDGLRARGLTE